MNFPPPPPLTAEQMLNNLTRVLMSDGYTGERRARYLAERAILYLLANGVYEWWGMTAEGEPLFSEKPQAGRHYMFVPVRKGD